MWYKYVKNSLLNQKPKKVVLSGPSGFLGSRVLKYLLEIHDLREENGLEAGEIILLSSSPGRLMEFLTKVYSEKQMKNIRASRVNYFQQHDKTTWVDQLGALGASGSNSVFVNLAALAGPVKDQRDAMMDVNYYACVSAAAACQELGFSHFVQSSTQATNAERSGQVPYAKHKSMADYALSRRFGDMPVSIASLSLLYCKTDGVIGQRKQSGLFTRKPVKLNLIDMSLLPLTPIMGSGEAPLQPQEVSDAAKRIAYLALGDTDKRPLQKGHSRPEYEALQTANPKLRYYDAVGPETISMLELLSRFARYQGKKDFRPVFIDYRRMEEILNIRSLGNLNRQFVSLLRSEQDSLTLPLLGNGSTWRGLLLGDNASASARPEDEAEVLTLDKAFDKAFDGGRRRVYPYLKTLMFVWQNPRCIKPGFMLSVEIIASWLGRKGPVKSRGSRHATTSVSAS